MSFPARVAAVVAAVFGVAILAMSPARAEYQVVADGIVQWEWVRGLDANAYQVSDVAVPDDGWMIVSTLERYDGYLHVVPPWGGTLGPSNRLGDKAFGFRQIEIRGDRIYGYRAGH